MSRKDVKLDDSQLQHGNRMAQRSKFSIEYGEGFEMCTSTATMRLPVVDHLTENAPQYNSEQLSTENSYHILANKPFLTGLNYPNFKPFVAGLSYQETQYDAEYIFYSLDGIEYCIPIYKRRIPYHAIVCTEVPLQSTQILPNLHCIHSQLNGNNGEASNSDDVVPNKNATNKRLNKESVTQRYSKNPGTKQEGVTLSHLLTVWKKARNSHCKALALFDQIEIVVTLAHVTQIKNEILAKFPDVSGDVKNLLNAPYPVMEEEFKIDIIDGSLNTHRVYIMSEQPLLNNWFPYVMLYALSFISFSICGMFTGDVFVTLFSIASFFTFAYSFYQYLVQRKVKGWGGVNPEFIGNSNVPVSIDPTFTKMVIVDSTFWKCKGYTHFVDIEFPTFFSDISLNQVHNVVAGCSTDSQLVPIAYATMMRDKSISEEFLKNTYPRKLEFYIRYYSIYVAQQHMYHLFQSTMMGGKLGKITLPGWDGSTLNFRYGGRIHGLIKLGIIRQYFEQTQLKEEWVDNGRFTVKKCVFKGKTYWFPRNTTPSEWLASTGFTEADHINQKRLQRYRTKLLTFHNGGILLGRTNTNLISALNRMFTCRENREFEKNLQEKQYKNVRVGARRLGKILGQVCEKVKSQFDVRCEIDELIGQLRVIGETHPKKKLREEAYEYIKSMTLLKETSYTKKVTAKVKIEVAKFMKNARVYVDMTTPQSLLGSWLVDPMKDAMKEIDLGWCLFVFVKTTDEDTIQTAFLKLKNETHRPVCVFHSDDAVLMLPCRDGTFRINLDISSCDRSNLTPIFDLLLLMVPEGPWKFIYERMIQGCLLPLVIPNPSGNGEYVKVIPTVPFEYSGCNLTTLLNNVALLVIASSIFWKFDKNMTKEVAEKLVTTRAQSVGYKVTVTVCQCVEQIQFLKFSPSDAQNWFPVRNLGCILRAVGHYDGDLPGKGELVQRAQAHIAQVVTGITTGYIDPLAQVLRDRFASVKPISNKYQWMVQKYSHTVSVDHLCHRYGLAEYQIYMLAELLRTCDIGDYVTSPILDIIFQLSLIHI